jgi:hypothetical protein
MGPVRAVRDIERKKRLNLTTLKTRMLLILRSLFYQLVKK